VKDAEGRETGNWWRLACHDADGMIADHTLRGQEPGVKGGWSAKGKASIRHIAYSKYVCN